jgi:hypothetical protein
VKKPFGPIESIRTVLGPGPNRGRGRCGLGLVSALALAAILLPRGLGAEPSIEGRSREGYRYSAKVSPERSKVGDLAFVEIRLEGISASSAKLVHLELDPGLKLEAESLRPFTNALSASPGVELRFELRVLNPAPLAIRSLLLEAEGRTVELGAVPVAAADAPEAPGGEGEPDWRWVAPARVYRYEAFALRLEAIEGASGRGSAAASPAAPPVSFAPPVGASIEASGALSWTAIAFEEGTLALPEARIGSGSSTGRAGKAKIEVRPLPPGLAASRAVGSFKLTFEEESALRPALSHRAAGSGLRARLVLAGRGNFPALALPTPDLRLDGAALPAASWSSSRIDEIEAEGSGYRGRSVLVLEILPPRAGLLSLSFPPFAVLDPEGRMISLAVPAFERSIGKAAPSAKAAGRASPDWGVGMGKAAALWDRGEYGKALAFLYGKLRMAPPLSREARDAKRAAAACSALLGTGPPLLDALPPPKYSVIAASLATIAGSALFITAGRRARGRRAAGLALLVLAFALAGLSFASAAERREKYAVIWADSLRTVPSALSELSIYVLKGSTAKLTGQAGAYLGLILADGVEGWAPRDSIYFY